MLNRDGSVTYKSITVTAIEPNTKEKVIQTPNETDKKNEVLKEVYDNTFKFPRTYLIRLPGLKPQ